MRCPKCGKLVAPQLQEAHSLAEAAIDEFEAMERSSGTHPVYAPGDPRPGLTPHGRVKRSQS